MSQPEDALGDLSPLGDRGAGPLTVGGSIESDLPKSDLSPTPEKQAGVLTWGAGVLGGGPLYRQHDRSERVIILLFP